MNHKFTLRESLLLLLCAIVGLGIFYYEVVYKNFESQLAQYSIEDVENEIMVYQAQVARKKQMENYIEEHKDDNFGEIALYNNLSREISELGNIFADVSNLAISWSDPTLTNTTVRRNASISFTVTGYDEVIALLDSLNNCKYRILITDVSLSTNRGEYLSDTSEIKASIRVTFYEYVDSSSNLEGLTILSS